LLLIDRDTPGITVRRMKLQGNWMAGLDCVFFCFFFFPSNVKMSKQTEKIGTSYITFDDVKVPVKNLIGKENEGFKVCFYFSFP
jgi:hypothetical protein